MNVLSGMNVLFRAPTKQDELELIARMRRQDVAEVAVMSDLTPDRVVPRSVMVSDVCHAMRIQDGPLLCIFGAFVKHDLPKHASIWELGTDSIDEHPKPFMRACRRGLRLILKALPAIDRFYNFIPETNLRSMRWLESLGAVFEEPRIAEPGILVRGFVIHRKDVPHV